MRRGWVAIAIASVLCAADAQAVPRGFTGSMVLQISQLAPIVIPGQGVAIVNGAGPPGHLSSLEVPAGAFASNYVLPITDPAAAPIRGIQASVANGLGSFSGTGGSGNFGGTLALEGAAKVCLFGPCSAALANLNVPLGVVGSGGFVAVTAAVNLTVIGAPWTTATASVGTATAMGFVAPLSNTDAIVLVTPVFISTNIGASASLPAFGYLSITGLSIPEPTTLALLGSGVIGLVAYGRRRRRA